MSFAILDVNPHDSACEVHPHGPVAAAIQALAKAGEVLVPPVVERHEVIAAKR